VECMRRKSLLAMGCVLALAFITMASLVSYAANAPVQQPRITQPIDEHVYVPLVGNTRPEAMNAVYYRGPLDAATPVNHMLLFLQRSPQQEQALDEYIDSLNDRKSPNYHKWLSADEYGQYGVAQADIQKITNWLSSQGFIVNRVYPNNMVIDISGTAGSIARAFRTQMGQLEVNGVMHIANMSDPQIPAALAPVITGFASLNDFHPHAMNKSISQYTFAGCASSSSIPTEPGTCYAMTPQDNQVIYDLNPLYANGISGQGQTIYLVEDTDTYGTAGSGGKSDWNTYRSTFGLSENFPAGNYTISHPGGCPDPGTNGDDGEAAIDVEIATAIAPSANINLISCESGSVTFGGLIATQNLIAEMNPTLGVISVSYGLCEVLNGNAGNAAFATTYEEAAAAGFSVFVASGDEGPSSCSDEFGLEYDVTSLGITGWGGSPYNVSVGGTDFEDTYNSKTGQNGGLPLSTYWNSNNTQYYGSALQYIPEIPWDDACASVLISEVAHSTFTPYGSTGTCNTSPFNETTTYISSGAGSGGASNCATGSGGLTSTEYLISQPTCQGWAKPTYQTGAALTGGLAVYGQPADGLRDIPDVSMFAANGVWGHYEVVCWSDPSYTSEGSVSCSGAPSTWAGFGGTSIATPSMAAIQALINQQTGEYWGNPNPIYYQIGQNEYGTAGGTFEGTSCNSNGSGGPGIGCAFNDVTQGDIDLACEDNGTTTEHHCYKTTGTYGVDSTDNVTAASVINGGTGYLSAPTCAIAGPTNVNPYTAPTGTVLFTGGTQAACTATVSTSSTTAVWTVAMESTLGDGQEIVLTNSSGGTLCGPYTLSGSATSAMAANLVTSLGGCSTYVTASRSSSTATITSKTAGYAGNFITQFYNNGDFFGPAYIAITNTTKGQGPNYVSGITITTDGSGYQPETPITLTPTNGGSGAIAVANTSPSTAAQSYQPSYGAAPGYDMATGLGSPNAAYLLGQCAWAPGQTPSLYRPTPNSQLTSTTATFGWCIQPGATNYWLDVGTYAYGNTLWQSGPLSPNTFAQTVNTLPNNGSTIYVTWWYYVNGAWSNTEYQYTAEGGSEIGVITSPTPGSTLTSSSQLFSWTAGSLSTAYWIDAGNTPEGNQYFQSGNIGDVTSYTVTGLPTDGSTIYITLWSYVNGSWLYNEYTYTAAGGSSGLAQMLSPTPGSEIDGYQATFTWSAGNGASGYWLDIGSTPEGNDIYQSGNLGSQQSTTVYSLPNNGTQIYATLWTLINGNWYYNEYNYQSGPSNGHKAQQPQQPQQHKLTSTTTAASAKRP